ncbi:Aspartyl protease family protein [Citrus sinensis]|uniref:Peptidase A1 domain-containing protein n=2 Tax=Citrus sinensis TaxID=2711 RepID=A0A067FIZ2_CITSI|nr:Aspartyl protease family protein [Citrus sinensis]KDO67374.1 hypothetical protein CISIN_1g011556mg [Citrus sinensis]
MALLRILLFACVLSLRLLCSLEEGLAFEETETAESQHDTRTIQPSSLLPSSICDTSTKANERKATLKVVHKHGPCNKLDGGNAKFPSQAEILQQDQSRVNSIHSKSRLSKNSVGADVKETDATTIPAKDGSVVATGDYVVTVGIGTPKKDLSLVFDTGSDLTWTQCEPCLRFCYQQKEPIYDPSASRTYANVSCSSAICDSLESGTGMTPQCAGSTCVYGIEYGDNSFSAGFFAKETLTLTSSDVFPNFLFGCGQYNRGLYGQAAGLLGLGQDSISLVSQTSRKYKKYFSYCLPSSSSSTGHLTFGKAAGNGPSKTIKFTPLSTATADSSFYGLDIIGLSVGGKKLPIPISVFSSAGAIIDSGTVITRLPPAAYSALRSTFKKFMSKYPTAPALSILDTCYDFSNYTSISVPVISFFFNRGVEVSIEGSAILIGSSPKQICLAFAGNSDDSDVAIIGNVQQKTLEVVYDVAQRRVGFAPKGCS